MKRFSCLALCLLLCCSLFSGCGGAAQSSPSRPQTLPEYNPNPLTGLEKDAGYPYGQRPVAVMINNIKQSLPQSGIAGADLIYEMVTEGGITRMMAVYSDLARAGGYIGPVRSARDQHLQLILPYCALYVHIGASNFARDMLETYHYSDADLDGNSSNVRDNAFWLDEERHKTKDIEHCWYTSDDLITNAIKKYELSSVSEEIEPIFNFRSYKDTLRSLAVPGANELHVQFSDSYYSDFTFDSVAGKYLKSEFGEPQIDAVNGEQLSFDNLFILFTDITARPDGVLMNVNYNFGGYGYYFSGGSYERVRWTKGLPEAPLRIVKDGDETTDVEINPGTSYIAMVGLDQFLNFTVNGINPLTTDAASSEKTAPTT